MAAISELGRVQPSGRQHGCDEASSKGQSELGARVLAEARKASFPVGILSQQGGDLGLRDAEGGLAGRAVVLGVVVRSWVAKLGMQPVLERTERHTDGGRDLLHRQVCCQLTWGKQLEHEASEAVVVNSSAAIGCLAATRMSHYESQHLG